MQVRRMRLARIECDDDSPVLRINFDGRNTVEAQKRFAQIAHTLFGIFSGRGDLDGFQNRMINLFGEERARWIGIIRSGGVHG